MEQFEKLTAKLSELFELEKADLDFGIHRIIKARQEQIRTFLSPDAETDQPNLRKIVLREMGEVNTGELQATLTEVTAKLQEEYGKRAFEGEQLVNEEALASSDGQQWQSLHEQLTAGASEANERLEAEIYSHLTTFFSRYYDDADFISLRRIKAGATPYAVPYSGEEVMLHWANKDQYYIKSSKDLKDYTFTLPNGRRVQFKCMRQDPVLNNNIANREFHLDDEAEIEESESVLLIPFHHKVVSEKSASAIQPQLISKTLESISDQWKKAFSASSGTLKVKGNKNKDAEKQRESLLKKLLPEHHQKLQPDDMEITLQILESKVFKKHLNNYTGKNESDFFIHKHLNRFLNQELDFYLKNEVMHLDDVDEKSADYLTGEIRKIKAVRAIAKHIITFLAQLENFQKKLWLKKKYVTETNFCLTLDRIIVHAPDLLKTVVAGLDLQILRYDGQQRSQKEEWEQLFTISELEGYPSDGVLTADFLTAHDKLMVDTAFFGELFRYQLLAALPDVDGGLNGLLVHSENFQALSLMQESYREKVKCVYIDPPYNTGGDGFAYKDSYQSSSWMSMISDRLTAVHGLIAPQGVLYSSIDEGERPQLATALDGIFGQQNRVEEIIWAQNTTKNQSPTYSTNHEYVEVYAKDLVETKADFTMFREVKPGLAEILELTSDLNPKYPTIGEIESQLRKLFKEHKEEIKEAELANDEWKGIYNYNRAEYRDGSGGYVTEESAKEKGAHIWIWREVDTSMPQVKEDSQKAEFKEPDSPTYRLYRPLHPDTKKKCPPPKTGWRWPYEPHGNQTHCFRDLAADHRIAWGEDEKKIPQRKSFLHEVETNVAKSVLIDFTDGEKELERIFGRSRVFGGPKPTTLTQKFCDHASLRNSYFCDFFAGSGTSGESVISYNRNMETNARYILVEMGDHFDTVLKPRIQKVVYSKDWKEGRPVASTLTQSKEDDFELTEEAPKSSQKSFHGISHTFKYLRLESYEDALNNLELGPERSADLLGLDDSVREDYLFSYLLDVETRGHLMNLERFRDPWACQLKIHNPHTGKSESKTIDLVETFSYLIGLTLRELKLRDGFLTLEGENPAGDTILVIWRKTEHAEGGSDWEVTTNTQLKAFAKDKLRLNPADTEYAAIYLNGDHPLEDPNSKIHLIEEVFYERMFEHTGNPDD